MASKPMAQIDAERRAFILAKKQPMPKGECNYCGHKVPPLAIWCSGSCAREFDSEKEAIRARG